MTTLLRGNLKTKLYCQDEAIAHKRKENNIRMKKSRDASVQIKRCIKHELELSKDCSPVVEVVVPGKSKRRTKPPRKELLNLWRKEKEKEKSAAKKVKTKPMFVVKQINYQNADVFNKKIGADKENVMSKNSSSKKTLSKLNEPQKSLQQQKNLHNIGPNNIMKKQLNKEPKKQKEPARKPIHRSCKTKLPVDVSKCNIESLSIEELHSIKTNKKVETTYNVNAPNMETIKDTKRNLLDVLCTTNIYKDNAETSIENLEEHIEETHQIVDGHYSFEAPLGLAFSDFQFNKDNINKLFDEKKEFPSELPTPEERVKDDASAQNNIHNHALTQVVHSDMAMHTTPNDVTKGKKLHANHKTPVSLFKDRQALPTTPNQNKSSSKRNSLTPNPKNFLSQVHDPIAQRLASPKPVAKQLSFSKIPPDVAGCVNKFTLKVKIEEDKFESLINIWENVLKSDETPEAVHGDILSAIGQAQLLMRKRFKQFKELIELHKDQTAEKAALASDLDGFWEMIYIQVDDVYKRFKELEVLNSNGWVEITIKPVSKRTTVKKVKKANVPATKNEVKKPKPRTDFKKFRQQMLAKKKSEEEKLETFDHVAADIKLSNEVDAPSNILTSTLVDTSFNIVAGTADAPGNLLTSTFADASFNVEAHKTRSTSADAACNNDLMMFSPLPQTKTVSKLPAL